MLTEDRLNQGDCRTSRAAGGPAGTELGAVWLHSILIRHKSLVRKGGLEPPRIAPPDPKSGASANFATFALRLLYGARGAGGSRMLARTQSSRHGFQIVPYRGTAPFPEPMKIGFHFDLSPGHRSFSSELRASFVFAIASVAAGNNFCSLSRSLSGRNGST